MLFLIDEQNKKGGLLGKQLEAVVVDPASDWPLFAEKARELISVNGVAAVFGCWTSVVAQVGAAGVQGAQLDPLLPRAVRGRRVREQRVLHRRRAEPAGDPRRRLPDERRRRLGEALGPRRHRLRLSAHDQQDPRAVPARQGRRAGRHHDQLHAVRLLRLADRSLRRSRNSARPARRPPWSRPSTATPTCRSTRNSANQGISAEDIPVVAFSVGEEELAGIDTTPLVGHLAAWNYFQSVDTPENAAFIEAWHDLHRQPRPRRPTTRWKPHCHRLQPLGAGGRKGRHHRYRRRARRRSSASRRRTSPAASPRCSRTTTSPSPC